MTTQANNSDAMDIELTVDDIETLHPEQVFMIHEKLRRSREHMKKALEQAWDVTEQVHNEAGRTRAGWQRAEKRAQRLESVLARVAVNMIDRGALEELLPDKDLPEEEL